MADAVESITQLLAASRAGDAEAAERLFSALYQELRAIARRERWRVGPLDTLSTTAVVHEAYLRLHRGEDLPWESRSHLLGTAAVAMRRLLIDYARERRAQKRGGGLRAVPIDEVDVEAPAAAADEAGEQLLALDAALERLAAADGRLAKVVELRFFGGLSEVDAARVLAVSERTLRRDWVKAKAFLHRELAAGAALPA
jgi:RNA polymerase sigma factor (TIGR02999 family)